MTHCKFCGRPAHLWGGQSCDVCDRDGNGINDKDEPVGFSPIRQSSVSGIVEKGFVVSGGIKLPKRIRTPLRFLKEKRFEIVGEIKSFQSREGFEKLKPDSHLNILLSLQRRKEQRTVVRLPQYRAEMERRYMEEKRSLLESVRRVKRYEASPPSE